VTVHPASSRARESAAELGRRCAAAGALVVALVALLRHAPVWLASLQGAATLVALLLVARLGSAALARAIDADHARSRAQEEHR